MSAPVVEGELGLEELQERRALIDRIAASSYFHRSTRLRDFLLYIGAQSFKEGCPEIDEHEIGARVFGRSPTYDRSQDNIVRVNATELRKRIEAYFAGEGADETLILEVPRGGYRPVFHRRVLAPATRLPSAEEPPPPSPESLSPAVPQPAPGHAVLGSLGRDSLGRFSHALWAALCLLLMIACAFLLVQNRSLQRPSAPWSNKPAVAALWTDFLSDHQQTDVVLADDSFSVIQDLTRHPIPFDGYLTHEYMRSVQSAALSEDRKRDLDEVNGHNLITFGSVRASQDMLEEFPASPTPHLTMARFYAADAMKRDNLVLIGGKKANPWIHLFDSQLNFDTDYDYVEGHAVVINRHPHPGEKAIYAVRRDSDSFVGYTVVAYLPSPSGTGKAFILAGTDSDATTAAAEFLTSEDQLEGFRNTLHVKVFPYFEILLRTSRLSGTSLRAEIMAYRTYPGLR
jgi:hypothetical protein